MIHENIKVPARDVVFVLLDWGLADFLIICSLNQIKNQHSLSQSLYMGLSQVSASDQCHKTLSTFVSSQV